MSTPVKKKRQQRAESRWQKTLRQLVVMGATLQEDVNNTSGIDHPGYVVVFDENTFLFRSRSQVQRWLKRTQRRLEEEQMSYAERHVRWMIEQTCDDNGNSLPE